MQLAGIATDASLRQRPAFEPPAEYPPAQVASARPIEQSNQQENENPQNSTPEPAASETATGNESVALNELEERRAEIEGRLYAVLQPVQIDQTARFNALLTRRLQVIVFGSLAIDVTV